MLARSGKVSMATKKRSGEEINDRQILCGMGIKLRRLTAGICLITQLAFPMAAAAQGVVNAATNNQFLHKLPLQMPIRCPTPLERWNWPKALPNVSVFRWLSYANSTSFVRLLEVLIMSARVMNWMSRHKLVKII